MRFQASLLSTIVLAAFVAALPHGFQDADAEYEDSSLTGFSALPEAGQVVFAPIEFSDDLLDFDLSDDSVDSAMVDDWKTEVVKQHNAYRAHYGASALTWSDQLYAGTKQWADQCKFQHSNGGGKYGENLAAGTGNAYGFSNGLKDWMDEAAKYDYNKPGFSSGTGHFTQVVWKSSKQVACAISNCRGGTIFQQPSKYLVCRYTPPGNFAGRYAENVGRYH
ncbi:PR-1 protein [Crucibulum laeve]|uniref:PR-1 protein n=1 Tax=Crucibulum laeve TaxID=68775 RepID=A0A5C3LK19_9AGAR|nr:PR-1 protein [Crucibulum laeve]